MYIEVKNINIVLSNLFCHLNTKQWTCSFLVAGTVAQVKLSPYRYVPIWSMANEWLTSNSPPQLVWSLLTHLVNCIDVELELLIEMIYKQVLIPTRSSCLYSRIQWVLERGLELAKSPFVHIYWFGKSRHSDNWPTQSSGSHYTGSTTLTYIPLQ